MPDRIPTFRPPWINRRPRRRMSDQARPNAHQRGYCSQGWKAARREVLLRDNYQCQAPGCGRIVTGRNAHVDHIVRKADGAGDEISGLQTLCASCHSKKTVREQRDGTKPQRWSLHPKWMPRACIPVTLVCGPPASGKSTYVEKHKGEQDLVVDLDVIASAMAGSGLHDWGIKWLGGAVRKRNEMLANLHKGEAKQYPMVWLIATEPQAKHRQWWVDTLGVGRVVVVETPAEVCEARMLTLPGRSSRCGNARAWWESYTPRPGDERAKTFGQNI
jgi:5-methylcytosine-specific restriction endonuclease McrA